MGKKRLFWLSAVNPPSEWAAGVHSSEGAGKSGPIPLLKERNCFLRTYKTGNVTGSFFFFVCVLRNLIYKAHELWMSMEVFLGGKNRSSTTDPLWARMRN